MYKGSVTQVLKLVKLRAPVSTEQLLAAIGSMTDEVYISREEKLPSCEDRGGSVTVGLAGKQTSSRDVVLMAGDGGSFSIQLVPGAEYSSVGIMSYEWKEVYSPPSLQFTSDAVVAKQAAEEIARRLAEKLNKPTQGVRAYQAVS